MIRYATTEDLYTLKEMWDAGFDDPLNYVNFIFDRVTTASDILVYDMAGKVAGMLTLLPVKFIYKTQEIDASYIFGATTDKRYRNRGVMTHLLVAAEDEAKRRGSKLTLLVPGERALINYYKKRGYSGDFFLRDIELKPGAFASVPAADTKINSDQITNIEMFKLRCGALSDMAHVQWSESQLRFVLDDCYIYGDSVVNYSGKYGESYAVYNIEGGRAYIKECLGSDNLACLVLLKEIIAQNTPKSAVVRQPLNSTLFVHEGVRTMYGMAKPLYTDTYIRDLDGYMNLMLD